jgi:hypothetical protein
MDNFKIALIVLLLIALWMILMKESFAFEQPRLEAPQHTTSKCEQICDAMSPEHHVTGDSSRDKTLLHGEKCECKFDGAYKALFMV